MQIRHKLCTAIGTLILISLSSPLYAAEDLDLVGEYTLTGIEVQYTGEPVITQDDASSWSGRASLTTLGVAGEVEAVYEGVAYSFRLAGFYTLQGSTFLVNFAGLPTESLTLTLVGDTLTTSGSTVDDFGDSYDYSYTWMMTDTYYTETQLDQAVADAVAGVRSKVVVVPLGN